MLRNVKDLRGYALRGTNAAIVRVEDFVYENVLAVDFRHLEPLCESARLLDARR